MSQEKWKPPPSTAEKGITLPGSGDSVELQHKRHACRECVDEGKVSSLSVCK